MKTQRPITGFIVAVMMSLVYASPGWSVDCSKTCEAVDAAEKPENLDKDHVIINVINGDVIGGSIRFPQTDRVQIVFVNKNPFKYRYRFNILSKSLDQSIIDDGLKLLGFSLPAASGAAKLPDQTFECGDATQFITESDKAVQTEKDLRALLKSYTDATKKYDKFIDLTKEDKIECATTCQPANDLLPHLDVLIDNLPKLEQALADLKEAAQTARATHNELKNVASREADEEKRTECLDNAEVLAREVTAIEEKLPEYESLITAARSQIDKFKELRGIIRNLSASSFTEVRYVPTTGASAVEISTFRRNLREDNSTEAQVGDTVKLTVGESRFSLSGGIGWSTLDSARIIRSRAPDPADATKTIEVFGEENSSELDPQIVAMMNARIGKPFNLFYRKSVPVSFAWSTGLVVATASSTDTVGTAYLTGPSLLLNDNAFVVSLLVHSARVGRLSSGFELGKKIPAELQDPLPVDNARELGLMLAITYRTR